MKASKICIALAVVMLAGSGSAQAQFWKKVGKALVSAAVGAGAQYLGKDLDDNTREQWNNIVSDFSSSTGLDDNYISAGNNFAQGKYDNAVMDVGRGVVTNNDALNSDPVVSTLFGIADAQNQYKNDINNGVDPTAAQQRRDDALRDVAGNAWDYYHPDEAAAIDNWNRMQADKEYTRHKEELKRELRQELGRRGYSVEEISMYMLVVGANDAFFESIMDENVETMANNLVWSGEVPSLAKDMADRLNIPDRTAPSYSGSVPPVAPSTQPSYSDGKQDGSGAAINDLDVFLHAIDNGGSPFFGDNSIPDVLADTVSSEPDVVEPGDYTIPIEPEPVVVVDPLAHVKEQLKRISPKGWRLNGIEVTDAQANELDEAAKLLKENAGLRIRLTGNSCDIGSDYGKERVSMQRARNAKAYLVTKGVSASRIEVAGSADSESLNDNATEAERRENRRVYITIID